MNLLEHGLLCKQASNVNFSQPRLSIRSVTDVVLQQSLEIKPVAARSTSSRGLNELIVYGFQTFDAYSSLGRTRAWYALALTLWVQEDNVDKVTQRATSILCDFFAVVVPAEILEIVTPR